MVLATISKVLRILVMYTRITFQIFLQQQTTICWRDARSRNPKQTMTLEKEIAPQTYRYYAYFMHLHSNSSYEFRLAMMNRWQS